MGGESLQRREVEGGHWWTMAVAWEKETAICFVSAFEGVLHQNGNILGQSPIAFGDSICQHFIFCTLSLYFSFSYKIISFLKTTVISKIHIYLEY